MGTHKKEKNRAIRQGKTRDGMANVKVRGENFYRDAKKAKKLKMYTEGKAQHNPDGSLKKAAAYQSKEIPIARIEPNRKWFGNTRVISQDALNHFRAAMAERASDPYTVLLKTNKLPMSLIRDIPTNNGLKEHQAKVAIERTPFSQVFGKKAQRKRVQLQVNNFQDLAGETENNHDQYAEKLEQIKILGGISSEQVGEAEPEADTRSTAREAIFFKGQSKRIWNELYKVIDSSDVVLHILDARDPVGTRCKSVEQYLAKEAPHKKLVFILNKCDLVPTSVTATWVRTLCKDHPTLAFHASITNSFGKGSLIGLLKQFSILLSHRKQISVGMIGFPNTGKSSIINTLRKKKVCNVAPIPGETKVWQYITLTKKIYLIDAPGIVPPNSNDTDQDILLRGAVRVENVEYPEQYIPAILGRVKRRHLEKSYEVSGFETANEFLELLARKAGRLLKGGEPDLSGVAKMVINDFNRGKIPWFVPPPGFDQNDKDDFEGSHGKLGETSNKRKRDESEVYANQSDNDSIENISAGSVSDVDEGGSSNEGGVIFEGFSAEEDENVESKDS